MITAHLVVFLYWIVSSTVVLTTLLRHVKSFWRLPMAIVMAALWWVWMPFAAAHAIMAEPPK